MLFPNFTIDTEGLNHCAINETCELIEDRKLCYILYSDETISILK